MLTLPKHVYTVMVFLVFEFLGCAEKKDKDLEVQLYLMVEGTCLENHVLPEHRANYKGGIIKWDYPGELPPGEKDTSWRGVPHTTI